MSNKPPKYAAAGPGWHGVTDDLQEAEGWLAAHNGNGTIYERVDPEERYQSEDERRREWEKSYGDLGTARRAVAGRRRIVNDRRVIGMSDKDVIVIVVNGNPLGMSVDGCATIGDVGQKALNAEKYRNALDEWEFRTPTGDLLPASMPVREMVFADDPGPDLFLSLRPGVGA